MMNNTNHVQLNGRLGARPEVRTLENGTRMARFTLAVNHSYRTRNGERVTDVHWHNVIAWGQLASIAEKLLTKGTQVTVDGQLHKRSYVNKAGEKRHSTEIVASEFFVNYQKAA